MKEDRKAFIWSVAIHLMACALVLGLMKGTTAERKMLVIDFSLGDSTGAVESVQPPGKAKPAQRAPEVSRPIPAKVAPQQVSPPREAVREPAPQIQRTGATEDQVPVAAPKGTSPGMGAPAPSLDPGAGGSAKGATGPGSAHGRAGSISSAGSGGGTERPEVRYVKAHFAAIRNAIVSKLSYPRLARRMGWAGTVKISFVVTENGGVNDVKVLSTSGFEVLDNNAVETIKRCSPYPRPPCMAEMVMPITYALDE